MWPEMQQGHAAEMQLRHATEWRRDGQDAGVPVVLVLTKDDRLAVAVEGDDDTSAPAVHARRRELAARVRRAFGFDGAHEHTHTCAWTPRPADEPSSP